MKKSVPADIPFKKQFHNELVSKMVDSCRDANPEINKFPSPFLSSKEFPWYENETKFLIPESTVKLLAFYLPQFHPFEENNRFWGKGFTEWHNVARALPVFQGHYQPRIPGELGYYDLRLPEVLYRQVELAKNHGISGFCFHHYFLNSKPVMRTPFNLFLQNPELEFPFCVHWANEPWTIRWDGNRNREGVLLDQVHDDAENMAFIRDLLPALADKRYIKTGNRPVLLVYRPALFPDFRKTADQWKEFCLNNGVGELFLVMVKTLFDKDAVPETYGFDAAVEFPPHLSPRMQINDSITLHNQHFTGQICDYKHVMEESMRQKPPEYTLFRGIMPQWDNTARNISATIYHGAEPSLYQDWLSCLIEYSKNILPENQKFIFINAWNEWAEGAYLEPDERYGFAWLNATARAVMSCFPASTLT